ncbi:MAG: sigma-70 family RNA polymerase sigma factor [Verrucomicrobiales bacterium]|nr:sigma-70 family RNA polymerase sigma factor [Verrucomicrobiales bacterium]
MSLRRSEPFHTTRWTCVLAARGDSEVAKAALSDLCEAYYEPVHTFIRATVRDGSARDLTHAFFATLLERDAIGKLERGRGKFRSYLLGAVKHFLADQREKSSAGKRGGGKTDVSLDADSDGKSGPATVAAVRKAKSSDPPDDSFFDRKWALAVLGRALDELAADAENVEQFDALKPWLTGDNPACSQAAVADELGISEGAVKVAIHRLRKKLRALVKTEISQTLDTGDAAEISGELDYLIRALG